MHWPIAFDYSQKKAIPLDASGNVIPLKNHHFTTTWKEMIKIQQAKNQIRTLGVSNFNQKQLEQLHETSGQWPSVNQIEVNPYCPEWDLVDFCQKQNIVVQAYAPFGASDRPWAKATDPVLLEDKTLIDIAQRLNKSTNAQWTPAALIIKWLLQRNIGVVVKSVNESRIKANLSYAHYPDIPKEEMDNIASIKTRFRYYQIDSFKSHPDYPYEIWDQ